MSQKFNLEAFKDYNLNDEKQKIEEVGIDNLVHYKNHPFKLYEGERMNDLVESIKSNGVFLPIIIRSIENDNFHYEILSGHNRIVAAKLAGLRSVPCVLKENITDDEANLIVTETNLIQRSFLDLTYSERAVAIATQHNVLLSFLKEEEQNILYELIIENENYKINLKKAEQLKKLSTSNNFNITNATEILLGKEVKVKKPSAIKLKRKVFSNYFINETQEEIEKTILNALDFYYKNKTFNEDKELDEDEEYDFKELNYDGDDNEEDDYIEKLESL